MPGPLLKQPHYPGCPRLQFWDAGEYDAPCRCEQLDDDAVETYYERKYESRDDD